MSDRNCDGCGKLPQGRVVPSQGTRSLNCDSPYSPSFGPINPCIPVCPPQIPTPVTPQGLSAYLYVFDTRPLPALPQTILPGSTVTFSNTGPSAGISHTAGSGNIVILTSGLYQVSFIVSAILPPIALQFSILLNGNPLSGVSAGGGSYGTVLGTDTTGQALFRANAGDIITLANRGILPVILAQFPSILPVETAVGASVTVLKIAA
jgi:hypothetical protein